MTEAHETLAGVYRALGEKEKSIAELKEILRVKQAHPTADQTPPFPMEKLLFSVQAPSHPPGSKPPSLTRYGALARSNSCWALS